MIGRRSVFESEHDAEGDTAEQKTKEVGIRKVLGAAVRQVVGMFLMVFLKIFPIASLIAVPLAYFMAEYWLENFAYRSPLSPLIFVASLLGLWFLTLITVGYETWRAAVSNPVNSLRTEWDPVGKIILSKGVVTAHHPTIPLTFPPLIVWG